MASSLTEGPAFIVSTLINREDFASTMIDSGCLVYALCDPRFANGKALERIRIERRESVAMDGEMVCTIREVVSFRMDLDGHQEDAYAYVMPLGGYDMILGMPWIR